MSNLSVINVDLVDIFGKPDRQEYLHTLAWGDAVEVLEVTARYVRIRTNRYKKELDGSILPVETEAYICPLKSSGLKPAQVVIPKADDRVLRVNIVDVQQADAAVIETADGKVILVDGGENKMFARYLAARFPGTSAAQPKVIDCIVLTHCDCDHVGGLTELHNSETNTNPKKRIFIEPKRVFHNGLVKRPEKDSNGRRRPEKAMLGPTKVVDGETIITGLAGNLLTVPDEEMNRPLREWKAALACWNERRPIEIRRLAFGDDKAFDFMNTNELQMSVLGPMPITRGSVSGLKFLGNPPQGPRVGHESLELGDSQFTGLSASHTINGHSIVFRLRYGGFSYLFCGDLNDEASRQLTLKHQRSEINLRSEVFKVPHHGSADFSGAFLQMVSPVISIVSSGDESASNEYIHPRATLIGALGRHSRLDESLVFVTELVSFFNVEGWAHLADPKRAQKRHEFFAFSRTAYGIVKTRTDGRRLLVYTDSGKADLKEAYCYELDSNGQPMPVPVVRV